MNPAAKTIYVETNELIEKWFELFFFVFCKITVPSLMIPYLVSCYYLYFVMDAKDEAFLLPFLAWYEFYLQLIKSNTYKNLCTNCVI